VNGPATRGFVPPRPNLGPEPWPEEPPTVALLVALGMLACVLLVGWLLWRRLRRGRARADSASLAARGEPDNTPRGRLLALAHSVRDTLSIQFGVTWRAKTTEELSADTQLEQVLGSEGLQELIRFLDQVDRLKFAPERSNHEAESLEAELAVWQPSLDALKKRIEATPAGQLKIKSGNAAGPASEKVLRA
jgi:hypothetical protein